MYLVLLKLSSAQHTTEYVRVNRSIILFYFYLLRYLAMYSFSPGWHFKTSSESRLCNSMVAKDCPYSILKLFICYYLLFWGWNYLLFPGGKLRPALTFSNLWVPLTRVFFDLWQSFIHNCCKAVYFGWIFSNRSLPPFPSILPLPFIAFLFPSFPSVLSFPVPSQQKL